MHLITEQSNSFNTKALKRIHHFFTIGQPDMQFKLSEMAGLTFFSTMKTFK